VTEVNLTHEDGKNNEDVKDFSSFDENVKYFPLNLGNFFNNLESVKITRGGLKEISGEDLKQFGEKLKKISLETNEIQKVEKILFENNKNLEIILLGENKIKIIEKEAFGGLEKLTKLSLEDNPCTSDSDRAMSDREAVEYLISEVEKKCKSE
jgi:Leucine-rich repeat (LRR) protein